MSLPRVAQALRGFALLAPLPWPFSTEVHGLECARFSYSPVTGQVTEVNSYQPHYGLAIIRCRNTPEAIMALAARLEQGEYVVPNTHRDFLPRPAFMGRERPSVVAGRFIEQGDQANADAILALKHPGFKRGRT